MLKTGDFVKVSSFDLEFVLNGIVLAVWQENPQTEFDSENKAKILCPELEIDFIVNNEERAFAFYVDEKGHFLAQKMS